MAGYTIHQNNALQIYNVTVSITRLHEVSSAHGMVTAPLTIVSVLPCHIKWRTGSERLSREKDTHYLAATLRCRVPAGVTIKTTDKVVYNGQSYEIVDVRDIDNLGRRLSIDIEKIT